MTPLFKIQHWNLFKYSKRMPTLLIWDILFSNLRSKRVSGQPLSSTTLEWISFSLLLFSLFFGSKAGQDQLRTCPTIALHETNAKQGLLKLETILFYVKKHYRSMVLSSKSLGVTLKNKTHEHRCWKSEDNIQCPQIRTGGDEGEEVTKSSQEIIQVSSSQSAYKHYVDRWRFWQKGILFFYSGKTNTPLDSDYVNMTKLLKYLAG